MAKSFRIEHDSMGELRVPADALWGAQTQRAVQNFPVSGRPMPRGFIRALGLVKAAAAEVNAGFGLLPKAKSAAIRKAALLRQKLEGLVAAHPEVFESVRGQGLMLGLKMRRPPADLVKAAYAEHLLTVPAADDTLRLLPPLTITDDEIAEAVARLDRAAGRLR